ncbi:MAG: ATP-grasp domain-containing protein [Desulfotignum sp.]|nr:ATP-grasp domain-containing protein [Desulfotignum sp.]
MSAAPKVPKVLVAGTTADYIQWIRSACPGQALFLTAPHIRKNAQESFPDPSEELVCPLSDLSFIMPALAAHLEKYHQKLSGIACFDCESMVTAALVAENLGLVYPDVTAVQNCRNKLVSKQLWQSRQIPCPRVWPVRSADDVVQLLADVTAGLVLKPAVGSGSELVFHCKKREEAQKIWDTLAAGLEKRKQNPLFALPERLILAEERICGPEYSCDFILTPDRLTLVRLAKKITPSGLPFGTAAGYEIPGILPPGISMASLTGLLEKAARTLGIRTGICMVDFVVKDNRPYLIEMTPRPGGDCLPQLLKVSANRDILKLTLDVAANLPWHLDDIRFTPHMGIRIHAKKSGVFTAVNSRNLVSDPRVKQLHLIRKPGHVITMPPADYDSWLLGHMIINTQGWNFPETRAMLLARRLEIEIQP